MSRFWWRVFSGAQVSAYVALIVHHLDPAIKPVDCLWIYIAGIFGTKAVLDELNPIR